MLQRDGFAPVAVHDEHRQETQRQRRQVQINKRTNPWTEDELFQEAQAKLERAAAKPHREPTPNRPAWRENMFDDTDREERLQRLQAVHDEAHRQGVREWQAQTNNTLSTLEDKQGLQAAMDKAMAKREAARVRNQGGTAFHDEHRQETQRQRRQIQINKRRARKVKLSEQDLRELDTILAHGDTNIQRLQTALAASMAGNTVATDLGNPAVVQQKATEGPLYPAKPGNRELSNTPQPRQKMRDYRANLENVNAKWAKEKIAQQEAEQTATQARLRVLDQQAPSLTQEDNNPTRAMP